MSRVANKASLQKALKKSRPGSKAKVVAATSEVADNSVLEEPFEAPGSTLDLNPEEYKKLTRERDLLNSAIIEEKREMGRESFWLFLTEILFPEIWKEHYSVAFHKPICDDIQNLKTGQDIWLILGRESRKSFIANISRSLWRIICDPNIRLLLVGAREATVKPFSKLIRNAFVAGTPGFEHFQAVYEDFVYKEGEGSRFLKSVLEFECRLRTVALPDPTFRASYLGVTGAGWRCDELCIDDPIERRNVTSPEMSQKALGSIMDLFPLIHTKSKYRHIIGCGTRYVYHDPIGKIIGERVEENEKIDETIQRLEKQNTKVIVRHAFEDPDTPCTHCPPHIVAMYPHGNPDMEKGVPVMAPIHTRESLMITYERYMTDPALGEAQFWHQYMNVCKAPKDQKIKDEWFLTLHIPAWPVAKRKVLCIDGAEKDFQRLGIGDYMVALMGEFDENGRLCIVHGFRTNNMTRDEFQRQIISWCKGVNWWPSYVVKEKFGSDSFLTDMAKQFLAQSRPVFCHAETRAGGKEQISVKKYDWIIASLQAPMERGEVVWGSSCPHAIIERAKYETTNLGQTAYDDVADTLALFFAPKVRVMRSDRGPSAGFSWMPPGMETYGYKSEDLAKMDKGCTILEGKDLEIAKARESSRIKDTFFGLGSEGSVSWDTPDTSHPAFAVEKFE